jgi:hypothetical protein
MYNDFALYDTPRATCLAPLGGLGMIHGLIWKRSGINLYVITLCRISHDFFFNENIYINIIEGKIIDKLKIAQVVPIHKKNSTLLKGNYRPVSILPTISKKFERENNSLLQSFVIHLSLILQILG